MTLSKPLRSRMCRFVVGVLAWAQLAVASYACPLLLTPATHAGVGPSTASACDGMEMGVPAHAAAAEPVAPPASAQLDAEDGALCLEHCRYGQQTNASTASPVVHAALLLALYPLVVTPASAAAASSERVAAPPEATAAPPPLAILHCCLRI